MYPLPEERGWKDTYKVNPGEIATFLIRYAPTDILVTAPVADLHFGFDPSKGSGYVWHCHIVDHEDNEMMRPDWIEPASSRYSQVGLNVTVNALPTPTINGISTVCAGTSGVTYATGSGTAISGGTGQSYTPLQSGWYWTQITINGCLSGLSNKLYRLKSGSENVYKLFPVPNQGEFTLSLTTPDDEDFTIQIYNQLGEKVYELTGLKINGEFSKSINLRPCPTGIYSVVVKSSKVNAVKRFTINQ